jgi:hypothetical protein
MPEHIDLLELDVRDPKFPARCLALTAQMRCDMQASVERTIVVLAESKALMAEIDHMLAPR